MVGPGCTTAELHRVPFGEVLRIQSTPLDHSPGSASTCCWLSPAGRRSKDQRPKWPPQSVSRDRHLLGIFCCTPSPGARSPPCWGGCPHRVSGTTSHTPLHWAHLGVIAGRSLQLESISPCHDWVMANPSNIPTVPPLVPGGRKICKAESKASCMGKSPYPQRQLAAGTCRWSRKSPGELLQTMFVLSPDPFSPQLPQGSTSGGIYKWVGLAERLPE